MACVGKGQIEIRGFGDLRFAVWDLGCTVRGARGPSRKGAPYDVQWAGAVVDSWTTEFDVEGEVADPKHRCFGVGERIKTRGSKPACVVGAGGGREKDRHVIQ